MKGKELLQSPLALNVWRAPLANELDDWNSINARSHITRQGYGAHIAAEYYSAGIDRLIKYPMAVETYELDGKAYVNFREIMLTGNSPIEQFQWAPARVMGGFEALSRYVVAPDGEITLHHAVYPQGRMPLWLPRIGLTMTLDKSLDQVKWYGRGPQENYPDRKTGYKTGVYSATVKDMYEPYLIPQDHGLRTDNRWLRMTDASGCGLEFSMDQWFNFNVYPFSTENLTKSVYTYQLQEQDGVTLNLDYATSGVGCTARGIYPAYRALPQLYEREVRMKLIEN